MRAALLIDFGSTRTKLTAVDLDAAALLGTAEAATTVRTDVQEGLALAQARLEEATGPLQYTLRLACSSAAGGLRMAASGLVPGLTAKAAKLACMGAGAKVVGLYSYELTEEDVAEIDALSPDIFLLCGGTDGGNSACITHNAAMLAGCRAPFPVLLAGNRSAAAQCRLLLAGRPVISCPNVMPRFGELAVEPVQEEIRKLFLARIIQAKGLSRQQELVEGILMPTPAAVLAAMELLAKGTPDEPGLGDLFALDLGGATTDVYSMALGLPSRDDTLLKGLQEPYAKRSVEGDIGMRYSAPGVVEALGAEALGAWSGLPAEEVSRRATALARAPEALPQNEAALAMDAALAMGAVELAARRHAGSMEQVYTANGPVFLQTGKDLRQVPALLLTGGALIHARQPGEIACHAMFSPADPLSLRPQAPAVYMDRRYILAAMGLLAAAHPACALAIMKRELVRLPEPPGDNIPHDAAERNGTLSWN